MTDVETDKKTPEAPRANQLASQIMNSSTVMTVLAVVISLVVGAVLIAFTDSKVQAAAGYFFARPTDMIGAIWDAVSGAYVALFNGAIYNTNRDTFLEGIKSITDTLHHATPLIAGGLGVALAFRAGLFNIGGRGQMLVAAGAAGWVGFSFHLPIWIHLPLAVIAGVVAGALWGGLVGYLKARTGAHEVILTIMLNYVAFYLISWMLRTPGLLQAPDTVNPESAAMLPTAILPPIFGERYNLHAGFILVILATVFVWWLLNRSNLGFKFRAVGENPNAARTAGINVKSMYIWSMLIAGGLMGLAGVSQVLGTITSGFSSGIDAGIGFDAITVALLGRSTPWGTFAAGILFGAFKAGGYAMQAGEGIPIDIVLVVQSVIVLFIAAPPLVRSIFFIPKPSAGGKKDKTPNVSKEVAAK